MLFPIWCQWNLKHKNKKGKRNNEDREHIGVGFVYRNNLEKSKILHKKLSPIINESKIDKLFIHGNHIMNTYKNIKKSKRGNILQYKSDFKDLLLPILQNNDYLMIKGSNATGLNEITKNLTKGRINAL